ncbi:YeeE/YedE family protein [Oxalobacter sp. OttesenSCG-928-P03]|nr:YeeE/YedE family protein [Oxalobacter sp. OttesenSCG-928-P03]
MTIDWGSFTPGSAIAGGVLIGFAVAVLLLLNGRIAGISGIIGGLLTPSAGNVLWRLAFVGGIFLVPVLYGRFAALPESHIGAGWVTLVIAGGLVGFGARLGSGCTSGHGVCGMSRFSKRSIVATLTFMVSGFAVVYVVRHVIG